MRRGGQPLKSKWRTKMKITLHNNFHNTEANLIVKNDSGKVSARSYNSALNKLCGMDDCCCLTVTGISTTHPDYKNCNIWVRECFNDGNYSTVGHYVVSFMENQND